MPEMFEGPTTKVYYYLDDSTPYLSIVPVSSDAITLGDFKKIFNKKGFKYFCKQLDVTIGCEVKVEIRDDNAKLVKSANGLIELVLMSANENGYASGTLPRASSKCSKGYIPADLKFQDFNLRKRRSLHDLANDEYNEPIFGRGCRHRSNDNSVTASSLSTVISKRAGEGLAELYTSNSEDPYHLEDINSRYIKQSAASSSEYLNSFVGAHRARRQRRPRKERYRKAYVPSTISSITESSMTSLSLPRIDVITLPMKNGVFLGISVLSHDGGIFVSEIYNGGAVQVDGRIEVGDQIVQVNRSSFENLSDAQAVDLLRKAAASKKPITLYVAKRTCGNEKRLNILSGLASETMPIDISLWVESTKQNMKPSKPFGLEDSVFVVDGDVTLTALGHETDTDEAYAERHNGIVHSNEERRLSTDVKPSEAHVPLTEEDVARRRENEENEQLSEHLNVDMDPIVILKQMALPDSGLQIKNRKWLKIPVPMSFIGRDLVDWLMEHVHGITDRKAARSFASNLLAEGHIRHVVNKLTFTEKCYYVFEDSILSVRAKNKSDSSLGKAGAEVTTEVTYVSSPAPAHISRSKMRNGNSTSNPLTSDKKQRTSFCESSTTNDYASVLGPDVDCTLSPTSTETPTLKLPSRPVTENLRISENRVAQPPNTPNSLLFEHRTNESETDFEVVEDEKRPFAGKNF